ncbi:MAG: toxin-antitoxin system protein [Actinomycetota bacterium]|nr:toxin-antitoxin system protein [Actinomycetota bacterium]
MSIASTTIKVSPEVRDRLNALAAEHGRTAGSMLEQLLTEHLWRHKMEQAKRQMRDAPPEVWAEYMAEFATMDGSLADGLEEYPWEP